MWFKVSALTHPAIVSVWLTKNYGESNYRGTGRKLSAGFGNSYAAINDERTAIFTHGRKREREGMQGWGRRIDRIFSDNTASVNNTVR